MNAPIRRYLVRWVLVLLLVVLPAAVRSQSAGEIEEVVWESVVYEKATEMRLYLEVYPKGAYVGEAWECLERMLDLDREDRILV